MSLVIFGSPSVAKRPGALANSMLLIITYDDRFTTMFLAARADAPAAGADAPALSPTADAVAWSPTACAVVAATTRFALGRLEHKAFSKASQKSSGKASPDVILRHERNKKTPIQTRTLNETMLLTDAI